MLSTREKIDAGLSPPQIALRNYSSDWIGVTVFSCAINLLMLTGPIFMLQVYDRVLTSRSIPTLVVLYALIVFLFGLLGLFNFFRTRVMSRVGFRLDNELMSTAQKFRLHQSLNSGGPKFTPVTDLSRLRQFIGSPGLAAFFDLPWVPIFIGVVFFMHPWLGWLTIFGVISITLFTFANERLSSRRLSESTRWEMESTNFSESSRKNAEAIFSMGMVTNTLNYWKNLRTNSLSYQQGAAGTSEVLMSTSKAIRLLLQSSILGLGCYLAVFEIITPGTMIAASIIGGRALSPIDQVVGNWRNFVMARQAYKRLNIVLAGMGEAPELTQLPEPEGKLSVSSIFKYAPSQDKRETLPILQGINFELQPGDGLGVIGPSASGKSSLARLLTGIWRPDRGSVRLDGATYDQWDSDQLGRFVGFLPQSVELMQGTIRANISRFEPEADDQDVIAAAQMANVHELIMALPGGYDAEIGKDVVLSGGQVQRIALARAVYRMPKLIVLDEPNSNLDADGDAALSNAIGKLREAGSTVVVMAHRPSAIQSVNKILMLRGGQQQDFGDKQDVLDRVTQARQQQQKQQPQPRAAAKPQQKQQPNGPTQIIQKPFRGS